MPDDRFVLRKHLLFREQSTHLLERLAPLAIAHARRLLREFEDMAEGQIIDADEAEAFGVRVGDAIVRTCG